MNGRKCVAIWLILAVLLPCMTACQMKGNNEDSAAGSRNAVSGTTVSGTTVSAEQTQEDFWTKVNEMWGETQRHFSHNGMAYFMEFQDDKWILVQQGSNGIRLEQYEIPELAAVWGIAGDWLYYEASQLMDEDTLWRVPIGKTEKGETLLLDQKEKLVTGPVLSSNGIYMSDSCLIFEGQMKKEDAFKMYKYDLQTKKCVPLSEKREFAGCELTFTSNDELAVFDGQLFIQTNKALYSLDPESGKMTRLMDKERENDVTMEQCGDSLYITTDHRQIYRYDGEGKKPVCVISKDIFRGKLEELQLWDKGEYRDHEITAVYAYEDRLYFSVSADWSEKKAPDQWTSMGFILLYANIRNIEELGFEDKLWDSVNPIWENYKESMEAMLESLDETLEPSDDLPLQDAVIQPSVTGGIVEGKMILLGDKVVPPTQSYIPVIPCMAYDLDTGEIMENPTVKILYGKKSD